MALLAESRGRVARVHMGTEANRVRFASIGPITSSTLRELGLPVDIEAARIYDSWAYQGHRAVRTVEARWWSHSREAGLSLRRLLVLLGLVLVVSLRLARPLLLIFRPTNSCSASLPRACGRTWRFWRTICWRGGHRHARLSTGGRLRAGAIRGNGFEAGGSKRDILSERSLPQD